MYSHNLHKRILNRLKAKSHTLCVQRIGNLPIGAVCYIVEKNITNHSAANLIAEVEFDKLPLISTSSAKMFLTSTLDVYDFENMTVTCITTNPPILFGPKELDDSDNDDDDEDDAPDGLQAVMDDLKPNRTFERVKIPFLR